MKPKLRKFILLIAGVLAFATIASLAFYWQPLVAWYEFQRDFETLPVNAQGLPEYKHRQTGIIFVKVPGGTFMMGSSEDEVGRLENELHSRKVIVSSFLIAKYEVTNKHYLNVMKEWKPKGVLPNKEPYFTNDNHPITELTWFECEKFCNNLGFSLPTELQWEYACRAESSTRFYFGESKTNLRKYAWYIENTSGLDLQEVGLKNPNNFGLFDMYGNAQEWCKDVYKLPKKKNTQKTELGEEVTSIGILKRVLKGGSTSSLAKECRSAAREGESPEEYNSFIGFRPVRNLE